MENVIVLSRCVHQVYVLITKSLPNESTRLAYCVGLKYKIAPPSGGSRPADSYIHSKAREDLRGYASPTMSIQGVNKNIQSSRERELSYRQSLE
jgi:hypothetical protein